MFYKTLFLFLSLFTINCYAQVNFIKTYHEGDGGMEGFYQPKDFEIDSEGRIFIVGYGNLFYLQAKDTLYRISYIEKYDVDDYAGLSSANIMKSAYNGKYCYTLGNNQFFFFHKNDTSDKLVFRQNFQNSDSLLLGYYYDSHMSITPDSRSLYIASEYNDDDAINIFSIDSLTGLLSFKSSISEIRDVNAIVSNDSMVFTSSCKRDTAICVYRRSLNPDSLVLVYQLTNSDSIYKPTKLALSHDNKNLYIYDNQSILVYNINPLSGEISFLQRILADDYFLNFLNGTDMFVSFDNKNLYFSGHRSVFVFNRNPITGILSFSQVIYNTDGNNIDINGIKSIKSDYTGNNILVLCDNVSSIFVFSRNTSDGTLNHQMTIADGSCGIKGCIYTEDILVSPDDKHLYSLTKYSQDAIALFNRLSEGYLEFIRTFKFESIGSEIGSRLFKWHPTKDYLYVASTYNYVIRVLSRNSYNGKLTFYKLYTEEEAGLNDVVLSDIAISNDGKNFYAATADNIIHYKIGQDSSDLEFVSNLLIEEPVNGLKGFKKIIFSIDGENVYTVNSSDAYGGGIAVYTYLENGTLQHVENYDYPEYPFHSVVYSAFISPDDKYLYAIGSTILCFRRDSLNGKLKLVYNMDLDENEDNNHNSYITDASMSSDGKHIILISKYNKAILSFYRNAKTGEMQLDKTLHYSNDYSQSSSSHVTFSNNMKNVYVVSHFDETLSVYKTGIPLGIADNILNDCGDTLILELDEGYSYLWSTGETTNSISIIDPGEYFVHVSDDNGREGWDTTMVEFKSGPKINMGYVESESSNDIYVYSVISEGRPPYNFLWSHSAENSSSITIKTSDLHLGQNKIFLQVTDYYGCTSLDSMIIFINRLTSIQDNFNNNSVLIYPNPFDDVLNVRFTLPMSEPIQIRIFDIMGTTIYESFIYSENTIISELNELNAGVYFLEFHNNEMGKRIAIIKK